MDIPLKGKGKFVVGISVSVGVPGFKSPEYRGKFIKVCGNRKAQPVQPLLVDDPEVSGLGAGRQVFCQRVNFPVRENRNIAKSRELLHSPFIIGHILIDQTIKRAEIFLVVDNVGVVKRLVPYDNIRQLAAGQEYRFLLPPVV